jgi:hypothetical protein
MRLDVTIPYAYMCSSIFSYGSSVCNSRLPNPNYVICDLWKSGSFTNTHSLSTGQGCQRILWSTSFITVFTKPRPYSESSQSSLENYIVLLQVTIVIISSMCAYVCQMIMWHVNPLLGNDREISDYTTVVTRQRPFNKRWTVFYAVFAEMLWTGQFRIWVNQLSWLVS